MSASPTVLIADDDPKIRKVIGLRLTQAGYRAIEAADGISALAYAANQADIVILDQCMPEADGCSVARVIRNESLVPIVFLSGCGSETFREAVWQLPEAYYVSKSAGTDKLLELIQTLVPPAPCDRTAPAGPAQLLPVMRSAEADRREIPIAPGHPGPAAAPFDSTGTDRCFTAAGHFEFLHPELRTVPIISFVDLSNQARP